MDPDLDWQAGIVVWVLTGDKQETAINIAHSCRYQGRGLIVDGLKHYFESGFSLGSWIRIRIGRPG
jgi:hypothetical protein